MKPNERGQRPHSKLDMQTDTKIDALLKDFFEQEVPAELKQPVGTPQLVSVSDRRGHGSRQPAGWVGLSVVAASLATVFLLLSQPATDVGDSTATTSDLKSPAMGVAAKSETPSKPDADIAVTEDFNDIEQFNPADGPVEQRSKLRIKNVSIFDPETGAELELFPELNIDIFPIDDEKQEPAGDAKGNDEAGNE